MYDKVVEILEEYVESGVDITMDSALVDDLGINSLDVVTIITSFEDEFEIEIPDRDIPTLRTVRDIVEYLEENVE